MLKGLGGLGDMAKMMKQAQEMQEKMKRELEEYIGRLNGLYGKPGYTPVEYLHRWDQLVGELCRSGFVLEDLREPYRGDPHAQPGHFRHRGRYIAPYVRLKARRQPRSGATGESPPSRIWTPDS